MAKLPPAYADDKLKMSELCLRSFARALKGVNAYVYVIFDNCPEEYKALFDKYLEGIDKHYIDTPGIGNGATFQLQCDLLLKQNHSERIYFAEDDFFYLGDSFRTMIDFLDNSEADFVSPLDHLDYHILEYHNHKRIQTQYKSITWTRGASTTMTFLTTKEMLRSTYKVFHTYVEGNFDCSVWSALTKISIRNPIKFIKTVLKDSHFLKIYAKAILYTPRELLSSRKYHLYYPTPSLSCHMVSDSMAPSIDWQSKFEELSDGI